MSRDINCYRCPRTRQPYVAFWACPVRRNESLTRLPIVTKRSRIVGRRGVRHHISVMAAGADGTIASATRGEAATSTASTMNAAPTKRPMVSPARQELLGEHDHSEAEHCPQVHHSERDEQRHERPATAKT